ncbi:MAG: T9SS type A sorting domain-containing protein [Bacteroidales bacterium]|nr:T9SS type A sorting domain-containing protein [Bacteroidales bacterium]
MVRYLNICVAILILISNLNSQNRWFNNYLSGEDPFGESITEFYDKGYLLAGRFGPNYPNYCWLIKTDINGELLWSKVLGNDDYYIVISADIKTNEFGEIYLVGSTNTYSNNDYDPLIMKLDSCGEKEWCKVFIEDGNNFSNALEVTFDGGVVCVLRYMNPNLIEDRICLAKLSSEGELIWKECYNSSDTSLYYGDAKDITICPDKGFLITGSCYYEDPSPPNYLWIKPYYIKTDSLGNFEWETIVHKDIVKPGGIAWSTVLSPDSSYYYSSINHFYYNPDLTAGSLVKIDLHGNVVGIYDLAPPNDHGALYESKFISDSTLMASASWGPASTSVPKAVIIDTLGNMLNSAFLLDNEWMAHTEVTYDNKLLFFTNIHDENDNFDAYLFKLNTELESDTIYTQLFNYDSLCPYQIASDTIVQDNCGLIVGDVEIKNKPQNEDIVIYPNPAQNKFQVSSFRFQVSSNIIEIFDIFGRKVKEIKIPKGQNTIEVNVEGWRKGLYLVRVRTGQSVVGSEKVIVN